MTFEYWFLFPVCILIATMAMATGIEGSTFYAPLFILALELPLDIAIVTSVITVTFGFSSGLYAYIRRRLIDYRLGGALLVSTIPIAQIGVWLGGRVDPGSLKVLLGVLLFALAIIFLHSPKPLHSLPTRNEILPEKENRKVQPRLVTADGETIRYAPPDMREGRIIAGMGALFIGMISTGQGEFNNYFLMKRSQLPGKVAVATSVFIVALTAMTVATTHIIKIATINVDQLRTIMSLAMFTVPGVLIGGQIGPMVACRLPHQALTKGIGALFFIVGSLLLYQAFF